MNHPDKIDQITLMLVHDGHYWTDTLKAFPIDPRAIEAGIVRIDPVRPARKNPKDDKDWKPQVLLDGALGRLVKRHHTWRKSPT